jgi:hypothetical protein
VSAAISHLTPPGVLGLVTDEYILHRDRNARVRFEFYWVHLKR